MEKHIFWIGDKQVESIGSMDEIEGMMECETAYRVLLGASYSRKRYPQISRICSDIMDDSTCRISCSPLSAANKFDAADADQPVPEDIFRFMEKAYLDGYALTDPRWCAFQLGRLYSEERYNHIHDEEAFRWFSRSAEAGSGEAEAKQGKCYLLGRGVERDYEKAFQALAKWAFICDENTEALCLLGDMYRYGLYVAQDTVQAYSMYNRGWQGDYSDSCIAGAQIKLRIAEYRMNKIGKKKDLRMALTLYQQAESEFYDYLLSHPREAKAGIDYAKAGQRKARRKLKKAILTPI